MKIKRLNLLSYLIGLKKEVLKMDTKIPIKNHQSVIDVFNDLTSKARLLLASTKECLEGISLVGALRVVLIDVL